MHIECFKVTSLSLSFFFFTFNVVPFFAYHEITEQHRWEETSGGLWYRLMLKTSLEIRSDQATQGFFLKDLQGWRLHKLPGPPASVLDNLDHSITVC